VDHRERNLNEKLRQGIAVGVLDGKAAIVTGSGQGIGKAVALRLSTEGAFVCVADLSLANAHAVVDQIQAMGGTSMAECVDVRNRSAARNMVESFVKTAGGLDILVNSAGVARIGPFLEIDQGYWDNIFDVNCKGTLWCSQAAAAVMISQGRGGKIINIASQSGRRGEEFGLAYCASKAAVISLTQSMALALAHYSINVNAVGPGIIDTPMWDDIDMQAATLFRQPAGEAKRKAVASVPLARIGRPEDVAGAAVFLASADGDYITQQCISVDGGIWPS
jgi:NAD(P)-dependent dehydrogenase (short-subunit alcohol dehydrogenase family)